MKSSELLAGLPARDRRGSRARCLSFTAGSRFDVAARLTELVAPHAIVDSSRHFWMPQGPAAPREAELGDVDQFLTVEQRKAVLRWWLAVHRRARTPNWDIVATATIDGREGLILIEAKAHEAELELNPRKPGRPENDARIASALREASDHLNALLPGWALDTVRCYQLCNRFAWAWKIAALGVPVILVYLGFLRANEMSDRGAPLADAAAWKRIVQWHGRGIVPDTVWERTLDINGTPLRALIRSE